MKCTANLFSVGQLAKKFGVCAGTIRRWCRQGKIKESLRTVGNHRRFSPESYQHLLPSQKRSKVGYARVSSHDQKSDLESQAKRLKDSGCDVVITDLGSGLNCRKPGLKRLLTMLWNGEISELVLTHDDRLLRFGKELIYFWCRLTNVKVTVLDEPDQVTFETELVKDVITLMTVFSARLYGKRSWKNRQKMAFVKRG